MRVTEEERMPLLPLTSDLVFKAVYGRDEEECKEALIGILNVILDRRSDPIVGLTYKNPFNYQQFPRDKLSIMDIKIETATGERVDVEMQVQVSLSYINRAMYYGAKVLQETIQKAEDYPMLKKGIVISILNENLFADTSKPHSIFHYREVSSGKRLSDLSELHFIELQKIDLSQGIEAMNELECLGAYMRCVGVPGMEGWADRFLERSVVISMTQRVLEKVSEDERLRNEEFSRQMFIGDQKALRMDRERRDKEQEARDKEQEARDKEQEARDKEQEARDKEQEARDKELKDRERELKAKEEEMGTRAEKLSLKIKAVVSSLQSSGMDTSEICQMTGLSVKEIEELNDSYSDSETLRS